MQVLGAGRWGTGAGAGAGRWCWNPGAGLLGGGVVLTVSCVLGWPSRFPLPNEEPGLEGKKNTSMK